MSLSPSIEIRRPPKSICDCRPGGVSKRTVASASAARSRRKCDTARSTLRRLTKCSVQIPTPRASRQHCPDDVAAGRPARLHNPPAGWARSEPGTAPRHSAQKPLNCLPIASNLRRDPPGAPTQAMKPLHRRHLVRRPHHLSPPIPARRRYVQSIRQIASPSYTGWLASWCGLRMGLPCRLTLCAVHIYFA